MGVQKHMNKECIHGTGAAAYLDENDLTADSLLDNIRQLLEDPAKLTDMKKAAKAAAKPDAAAQIAGEVVRLATGGKSAPDEKPVVDLGTAI
eukprot:2477809-Pyramimonas_sp.AAC.2